MISLKAILKTYQTEDIETLALSDINLTVSAGEFVGIMGPSGCGKSTLLSVLGLIEPPTGGTYHLQDEEVSSLKEDQATLIRMKSIGFIFQSFNLIENLTIEENVELPLVYCGIKLKERKERTREVLDELQISHRMKHFPTQLSGGQQQRVAIARAIAAKPIVILADEPTGNLDSENGTEVMRILTKINRNGTTIVMVTHSNRDADYAHRIIHMSDGKIQESI